MAGHNRTVDTGRSARAAGGKPRKIREHLPPGQVPAAKRAKAHAGARTTAMNRISRTADPLRQLDHARDYLRSAVAKYTAPHEIHPVVEALLAAADRIYRTGTPVTEAARRTRRDTASRHRKDRTTNQVLIREGKTAIRRQQDRRA